MKGPGGFSGTSDFEGIMEGDEERQREEKGEIVNIIYSAHPEHIHRDGLSSKMLTQLMYNNKQLTMEKQSTLFITSHFPINSI